MSGRALRGALTGLLFVALTSCPKKPRTQLFVRVQVDEQTLRAAPRVHLTVHSLRLRRDLYNGFDGGIAPVGPVIAEVAFVPEDPSKEDVLHVTSRIVGSMGGREVSVAQNAEVLVEEENTLVLVMSMTFRCLEVACPERQTCAADERTGGTRCVPIRRQATAYAPLRPADVPDASDIVDATEGGPVDAPDDVRVDDVRVDDVRDAGGGDASDGGLRDVGADVDLSTDPANCGALGTVCSNLQECRMGRCEGSLTVQRISLNGPGGCVLMSDRTVRCWGARVCDASFYPPGGGPLSPARLLGASGVTALAAGDNGVCWITAGVVRCCGNANGVARIAGESGTDVVAGNGHACVVAGDGGVRCAGANAFGQCGNGRVETSSAPSTVSLPEAMRGLYAGHNNACALTVATSVLYCWGQSQGGQIGAHLDGGACTPDAGCPQPQEVSGVAPVIHAAIDGTTEATGGACAANGVGQVFCWGSGPAVGYGPMMEPRTTPRGALMLPGLVIRQVARGFEHACVLDNMGALRCWGSRRDGRLGDWVNNSTVMDIPPAMPVMGLPTTVAQVDADNDHTCALLGGSDVRCWGNNDQGQLGVGDMVDRDRPTPILW